MANITNVKSTGEWQSLLSGNNVVVADFYADWCGPCKMIAPHFERLAKEHARPKKVAFAKVNVDEQSTVARTHGVSAMPTFLVLHSGKVVETIKGANPSALSEAVAKAARLGDSAGGVGTGFKSPGQRLGGASSSSGGVTSGAAGRLMSWDINNLVNLILTMVGLYLASLFSFDPYKAAEASSFNVHRPPPVANAAPGTNGARAAPRPAFRTLADLGEKDQ